MYPTATDVEVKLKSSSFWPTDATKQLLAQHQAQIGAAGAAAEWERMTGWNPFLAPPASQPHKTRPYNGSDLDGVLNLRAAAQEISSVSVDGRVLVAERDFWLLSSADEENLAFEPPYTALKLLYPMVGSSRPGRVKVTARWGYVDAIPPDVWQKIQEAATLVALTSIENLQSIASIGIDGFNKAFDVTGIITQQNLLQTWGKDFHTAAKLYARGSAQ
ncbi:MAG TPA: hypothetical protein VGB45_14620 [Abditibacterium sp.]|jgi:hypothetical protein